MNIKEESTTSDALQAWVGREQVAVDTITPSPYAALKATLDDPVGELPAGTPLPERWHWLYFLDAARQSDLGNDGHVRRGRVLPPVALPRRMWAGGQFEFGPPYVWVTSYAGRQRLRA